LRLREEAPPLVRHAARDGQVHEHAVIAAAESLQDRHALAPKDPHLAGLHAGRQLERDAAVERLHIYGSTERRLHDREVDLRVDVVALADEARIGSHAHVDVDVAGAATEGARMSLAGDADALPALDARRHVDPRLAALDRPPGAAALVTRVIDQHAATAAVRARLRAHELAEHAA